MSRKRERGAMLQMTFSVPKEMDSLVRSEAERLGISMSEAARRLMEMGLQKNRELIQEQKTLSLAVVVQGWMIIGMGFILWAISV